jgi:hypothetical protein
LLDCKAEEEAKRQRQEAERREAEPKVLRREEEEEEVWQPWLRQPELAPSIPLSIRFDEASSCRSWHPLSSQPHPPVLSLY